MFLSAILIIMILILATLVVLALSIGGAIGIVLFGDTIVCVWLIIKLIKKIFF